MQKIRKKIKNINKNTIKKIGKYAGLSLLRKIENAPMLIWNDNKRNVLLIKHLIKMTKIMIKKTYSEWVHCWDGSWFSFNLADNSIGLNLL